MCLAQRTVNARSGSRPLLDRFRGKNRTTHVVHCLRTDFFENMLLDFTKIW